MVVSSYLMLLLTGVSAPLSLPATPRLHSCVRFFAGDKVLEFMLDFSWEMFWPGSIFINGIIFRLIMNWTRLPISVAGHLIRVLLVAELISI